MKTVNVKIPEGFVLDEVEIGNGSAIVLTTAGRGFVTVDIVARGWRLGAGLSAPLILPHKLKRQFRQDLINQACAWFDKQFPKEQST